MSICVGGKRIKSRWETNDLLLFYWERQTIPFYFLKSFVRQLCHCLCCLCLCVPLHICSGANKDQMVLTCQNQITHTLQAKALIVCRVNENPLPRMTKLRGHYSFTHCCCCCYGTHTNLGPSFARVAFAHLPAYRRVMYDEQRRRRRGRTGKQRKTNVCRRRQRRRRQSSCCVRTAAVVMH